MDRRNRTEKWNPPIGRPAKNDLVPAPAELSKKDLPKPPKSGLAQAVNFIPPLKRAILESGRKTLEKEAGRKDAETEVIKADTRQQEALIENAATRTKAERKSLPNRVMDKNLINQIATLERTNDHEEAMHQLELNRRRRAKELGGESKTEPDHRALFEREAASIIKYGTTGEDRGQAAQVEIDKVIAEHGADEDSWPEETLERVRRLRLWKVQDS